MDGARVGAGVNDRHSEILTNVLPLFACMPKTALDPYAQLMRFSPITTVGSILSANGLVKRRIVIVVCSDSLLEVLLVMDVSVSDELSEKAVTPDKDLEDISYFCIVSSSGKPITAVEGTMSSRTTNAKPNQTAASLLP